MVSLKERLKKARQERGTASCYESIPEPPKDDFHLYEDQRKLYEEFICPLQAMFIERHKEHI